MDATGMMYVMSLFAVIGVFLAGICLLLVFRLQGALRKLRGRLGALEDRLREHPSGDAPYGADDPREGVCDVVSRDSGANPVFSERELKRRLESAAGRDAEIPEKYRYIAALERSGLGPAELSEIFDVSENEARQMLALSRSAEGRAVS